MGLATLATWTCDTRDMRAVEILTSRMAKSSRNRLALPPRPDSMAVTDGAFAVTAMLTRAEYLARSLSRRQPWLAEGISRRQWERRRRKKASHKRAGQRSARTWRRDLTANVGSRSKTSRAAVRPADDINLVPARKRIERHDEDLLMRHIHAYWDAQGMTPERPASAGESNPRDQITRAFQTHGRPGVAQSLSDGRGGASRRDTTAGSVWSKNGTNRTTAERPATWLTASLRRSAIVRSEFSTECLIIWSSKSATTYRKKSGGSNTSASA